jgi:signal transduction histidine kinase
VIEARGTEIGMSITIPSLRGILSSLRSGVIRCSASNASVTSEITLIVRQNDEDVHFSVKDTGCGIDSQYHELIFEEFKQADAVGRDPRAGAGLGLAISRQLLGLMNGRIWLESEVGKGSTFHFTLPACKQIPEVLATAAPTEPVS